MKQRSTSRIIGDLLFCAFHVPFNGELGPPWLGRTAKRWQDYEFDSRKKAHIVFSCQYTREQQHVPGL
jgi:hypothetical protein